MINELKFFFQKRILAATIVTASVMLSIFFFQNCSSDIRLESALTKEEYTPPAFNLKATVCPDARGVAGPSSKFVFIVDMSASNIGDWDKDPSIGGKAPLSYWDKTKATDIAGDRFKAVANFLDTCGANSESQFAIIGFSKTAGIVTGTGASAALGCGNVNFTNSATAKTHLNNLKLAQETDSVWYFQWQRALGKYLTDPNSPPILGPTSYISALDCAKNVTMNDLLTFNSNSTQNYHIAFISDGVPVDSKNTGCNLSTMSESDKLSCHLNKSLESVRIMRQSALSKGRDLRIHGVFYGPNPNIPVVMDAISKEGGTLEGTYLKSFSDDKNALCNLILTQSTIDYQPENLTLINLNTINKNGRILADSDMDGVSDEEEITLGSDPQDARSLVPGVLDGICKSLGGKDQCLSKRLKIQCLPDQVEAFGLTECDIKILDLDKIPTQLNVGLDADKDGIPDFIEIIKGTNPTIADMTSDPDGDGIVNRDEIIKGTDVNTPDIINDLYINKIFTKYSPPSENICQYGGWSINSSQLQIVKTQENYNLPVQLDYLTHGKQQYLMLVLYRLSPTNSDNPVTEYYSKVVTVDYFIKNGKEYLNSLSATLNPNDFTLLGQVKP